MQKNKKKKCKAALLCPVLWFIMALTALGFDAFWGIVDADPLNIRAKPVPDAEVLGQFEYGESIKVTGVHSNWYAVVPPDRISFFVHKDFIEGDTVRARTLNVRSGASVNYSVVGQLNRGDRVHIIETFSDWHKITAPPSARIWVHTNYVKVPPPPPELATPEPENAEPLPSETTIVVTNVVVVEEVREVNPREIKQVEANPARPVDTLPDTPPDELAIVPLPGQGKIVRREGELKKYLFKMGRPSQFRLVDNIGGRTETVCYVAEDESTDLLPFVDQRIIIQGKEYWVQGEARPVIDPQAIILKNP